MRPLSIFVACSIAIAFSSTTPASAGPLMGADSLAQETTPELVQEARIFCYNTYSGRFLHWGSCGGYRVSYRPRVYCRNRYSGQFLHWGRC